MFIKPMLTTLAQTLPKGADWIFEPKYDGFRCLLIVTPMKISLQSRNGKDLSIQFPEIIDWLTSQKTRLKPCVLDGELVCLMSDLHSNFSKVLKRARLRTKQTITKHAEQFPCQLMVFDILSHNQKSLTTRPLLERKTYLQTLFDTINPEMDRVPLLLTPIYESSDSLIKQLTFEQGEGIVAKRKTSSWQSGKRSPNWLKWKLKKTGTVILTHYNAANDYFTGKVYGDDCLVEIVKVSHGFSEDKRASLISVFKQNGTRVSSNEWELPPGICAEIACIGLHDHKLREPSFIDFNLSADLEGCTLHHLRKQLIFPSDYVDITHPTKPIWTSVNKSDYLYYLQRIAPTLLLFLKDRLLTVIRYPHGGGNERFYQKNRPESAPTFIESVIREDTDYILCNQMDSLLWLGNLLALEFHIPFQRYSETNPSEIVIDLDPPSIDQFQLAVQAAKMAKAALDVFHLTAYVKTSGGKGIQVYIPLPHDRFTYKETRTFTLFLCQFLYEQQPELFTLERLKKNRANRLYLDYVQHDEGKTIIAPYSTRGDTGYVATPLEWEELENDSLHPSLFTVWTVLDRLDSQRDPFREYELSRHRQPFSEALLAIQNQTISH
ncbi:DNA ligase D [Alkalicoccobacillus murimartini]|uniref:Bifunctional non-homologous end joining protein LigD n=1 Tax=Alkalicoccobacillus murimartini TaxID=171685 RepID=A0ABT9YCU8_9BACI|nr:DNA ligase D [Alkalicoccobacillus murimartini]MDQ0205453.1 bifunctional non-homologous end joining protein LigD [Alkalicoccobacillus murimartini]